MTADMLNCSHGPAVASDRPSAVRPGDFSSNVYLNIMAFVQLPSIQGGDSLLRVLRIDEVYEGKSFREASSAIEWVRQSIFSDGAHAAEDLPYDSS